MAQITFNLADIFEETYGYRSQAFDIKFDRVSSEQTGLSGRTYQSAIGSPYYGNVRTKNEYYMPVTITYEEAADPTWQAPDGSFPGNTGIQYSWDLPHPVISITSRKTIVETPLTERRGTVKELINVQDYDIVIKGFIINEVEEFPEAAVTRLRTIYEKNEALSVKCPLTDIFLLRPDRKGSDKVVIKELKFPAVTGIKNVRPYELHLVSDSPFNLISIT